MAQNGARDFFPVHIASSIFYRPVAFYVNFRPKFLWVLTLPKDRVSLFQSSSFYTDNRVSTVSIAIYT
jgi:hypothetical protein